MGRNSRTTWSRFINLAAFVSLTLIGVALMLSHFISGNSISDAFWTIAMVLAYIIVAFYALIYAIERRRTTMGLVIHLIIWAVAVTLIVVFVILGR